MDFLTSQFHLNMLKAAEKNYRDNANYYSEVADLFSQLTKKLEVKLEDEKQIIKALIFSRTHKLLNQNLENRKKFITNNKFNEYDLQNLYKVIHQFSANNVPTLELFPGSGQFLPYAVASEPLYIADKFIEICNEAGEALNNPFYSNRRLRKYEIKTNDMTNLPKEAFGLIYSFNEFFSADEEYITEIAKQVYYLLYNGGKFIFNFIPHDQVWAQQMVMNSEFTLINYENIIDNFEKLDFSLVNYKIQPLKSSYIIFEKKEMYTVHERIKVSGSYAEIIDL